ncbi:MAG: SGNH/GDSL hydrolase family protein [Planctomycetota bacterium]
MDSRSTQASTPANPPGTKRSTLRTWLLRLVLSAGSAFAALLVGEAWARGAELAPPALEGRNKPLCRPRKDDSGLRYELVPNRRTTQVVSAWGASPQRQVQYSVNRQGFRGELAPIPKPAGEFRIVVVGDSFVFGSVVDDPETFPAQLESRLAERFGPDRVRVINLGVPGYQARQYRATLKRRVARFEPDLVLINFYVNDPIPTPPTHKGPIDDPDPIPRSSAQKWIDRLGLGGKTWELADDAPWQRRAVNQLQRSSKLFDRISNDLFQSLLYESNMQAHLHRWRKGGAGFARILETLGLASRLSHRNDFELHVSMYPMLSKLDDYPLADAHARVGAACALRGVTFHDFLPALAGRDPATLWAHEMDHHPNAACHALVAGVLAEALADGIAAKVTAEAPQSVGR